jgi:hypothetical protein
MFPITSPFLQDSANAYMGARHLSIETLALTVYNTNVIPKSHRLRGKPVALRGMIGKKIRGSV